jgi:hypothetical protein
MVEDIGPETLLEGDPKKLIPPPRGALLKIEQDVHLIERVFLTRARDARVGFNRAGLDRRLPHRKY